MRFLAVDPGGRRMGLAVGDDVTGVASPLRVVPYTGVAKAAEQIRRLAAELAADVVVLGLPTDAEGRRTTACARTEALARALGELGVEVELQPEYLTSNEARRRARSAGVSERSPIDHIAAQVILEEALERRRRAGG